MRHARADIVAVKEAQKRIGGIVALSPSAKNFVGGHVIGPKGRGLNHDERLRMLRVRLLQFQRRCNARLVPASPACRRNAHNALDVVRNSILG